MCDIWGQLCLWCFSEWGGELHPGWVNRPISDLINNHSWSVSSHLFWSCRFDGLLSGDHTKALIGQLIIFNQILGELRQDIREQVRHTERQTGLQRTGYWSSPVPLSRWKRCLWSETPSWSVRFVVSQQLRLLLKLCHIWGPDWSQPVSLSVSAGFHEPRSRCSPNPCYKGVSCMESLHYPGYTCGPCPPGTTGNGTHCHDINEVTTTTTAQQLLRNKIFKTTTTRQHLHNNYYTHNNYSNCWTMLTWNRRQRHTVTTSTTQQVLHHKNYNYTKTTIQQLFLHNNTNNNNATTTTTMQQWLHNISNYNYYTTKATTTQ